jgi:hypothetical protein
MTFKIEILTETGAEARQQMALFLGLPFAPHSTLSPDAPTINLANQVKAFNAVPETTAPLTDEPDRDMVAAQQEHNETVQNKRKRGEPSPGKARRTKAEIAEDDAADAADRLAEGGAGTGHALEAGKGERPTVETATDTAIDIEQDQADEAAETAANRSSDAPTLDDLRRLMGEVQRKHGMTVAIGIPKMLGKPIVDLTPEELPAAIARVQGLLDGTDQTPVTAETKAVEPTATADDVRAAMLRYAAKYEGYAPPEGGPIDGSKIQVTSADSAKVFSMLFGEGVVKVSSIPADAASYAKAVAGIEEMIEKNPFKR